MALLDWGDVEEEGMEGPPIFRPHDYPHLLPGVEVKDYVVTFSARPDNGTRLLVTADSLDECIAAIRATNPYSYGTQEIIADLSAVDYTLSTMMGVNVQTLVSPVVGEPFLMEPDYMELCFSIYDADQVPMNAEMTERFLGFYEEQRERDRQVWRDASARLKEMAGE